MHQVAVISDRFEVVVDDDAETGDAIGAMARLLIDLTDKKESA